VLFNTLTFAVFFVLVLALLPRRNVERANIFLLIASAIFYAAWDWRFLPLLAFSAVFNFACGNQISDQEGIHRRSWLAFNVLVNLMILVFFKYYLFLTESFQALLAFCGLHVALPKLSITLPLAISFYTFHCLSYTIDIYRRELKPAATLRDFSLYLLLFPHQIAGPIVRASKLLPQISSQRKVTAQDWQCGLFLIFWGLFKKMAVADNLGPKADRLFNLTQASSTEIFLGVLAFAFQIYADFSGYTDIARGTARLLGFNFDLNFRSPYLATDPQDFWRRWHISLSHWLRDYVYVSLGGNRNGSLRTYRNLLLTMVIGGLWHGAAWNFVLWGAYHGLILCFHRFYQGHIQSKSPSLQRLHHSWLGNAIAVAIMFVFTLYGWLLFRAVSIEQVVAFTKSLIDDDILMVRGLLPGLAAQAVYFLPLLLIEGWMHHRGLTELVFESAIANGLLYFILIALSIILGAYGTDQFIYFNF
jgi:D-alanyl-lipoteichoic acid acyltransferase DltB (MBOAT superfamily)